MGAAFTDAELKAQYEKAQQLATKDSEWKEQMEKLLSMMDPSTSSINNPFAPGKEQLAKGDVDDALRERVRQTVIVNAYRGYTGQEPIDAKDVIRDAYSAGYDALSNFSNPLTAALDKLKDGVKTIFLDRFPAIAQSMAAANNLMGATMNNLMVSATNWLMKLPAVKRFLKTETEDLPVPPMMTPRQAWELAGHQQAAKRVANGLSGMVGFFNMDQLKQQLGAQEPAPVFDSTPSEPLKPVKISTQETKDGKKAETEAPQEFAMLKSQVEDAGSVQFITGVVLLKGRKLYRLVDEKGGDGIQLSDDDTKALAAIKDLHKRQEWIGARIQKEINDRHLPAIEIDREKPTEVPRTLDMKKYELVRQGGLPEDLFGDVRGDLRDLPRGVA